MIPFENTDLHIVEIETEDGSDTRLYFLLNQSELNTFDPQLFLDELDLVMPKVEKNPELFDSLLEKFNVLELFDQEDIEELIDEGMVDPEDLHQSLYDFYLAELNMDVDFSDSEEEE